ncbi:hypothetical protein ACFXN2_05595 [Streptomyces kronopolitis]|uniref:hypothetical protein n=1 Tax=Streptomyces kronopolitis TaxID=1612435 RepID=UPI003695078D
MLFQEPTADRAGAVIGGGDDAELRRLGERDVGVDRQGPVTGRSRFGGQRGVERGMYVDLVAGLAQRWRTSRLRS